MASSKKPKKGEKEKAKKPRSDGAAKPSGRSPSKASASGKKRANTNKKRNQVNGGGVEEPEVCEISGNSIGDSEEEEGIGGAEKIQRINGRSKSRNGKSGGTPKKRRKDEEDDEEDGGGGAVCRFPMNRIRRIMRSENVASQIMQEAVFLVNKATEMFIERFSEDAYECSIQDKKKFIHYKHLSSVVSNEDRYEFLSDFVPEKVKAEDALEQWKTSLTQTG